MIGKKTRPVIGKLMTGTVFSGNRPGNMEVGGTSPRTPLESKVLSPRGFLNFDMGGVGLGIVAALEKSCHGEIPASKIPGFYCRNPIRSDPIPVNSPTGSSRRYEDSSGSEDETDSSEEYTFVTRHRQNRSYTRVYRDGGECVGYKLAGGKGKTNQRCIFDISPARFGDSTAYPPSDFLSYCHLCKKKLHGEDIYIYRGEKAFCSAECRYREIGMEERREKYYCSSEFARTTAVEVSNSPYTNGQMFTTGIFAI